VSTMHVSAFALSQSARPLLNLRRICAIYGFRNGLRYGLSFRFAHLNSDAIVPVGFVPPSSEDRQWVDGRTCRAFEPPGCNAEEEMPASLLGAGDAYLVEPGDAKEGMPM
jgi:hypothetical protein